MIDERFIILTIIVNLIGGGRYIISTLKGKTKPNRVTWFMFTFIASILFIAMLSEDASITALIMTFTLALVPFTVLVSSFVNPKAEWKLTRFDLSCGALSLVGVVAWLLTGEGNLAILFSLGAQLLALLPTLRKSINKPETENPAAYFAAAIGAFITLLTVDTYSFASLAFPIYILLTGSGIAAIIRFRIGPRLKLNGKPGT